MLSFTRRDSAAAGEAKRISGRPSSTLDGLPLAIKGNFMLCDVPMNTARTQLLRDHVPGLSATLVRSSAHPVDLLQYVKLRCPSWRRPTS
jgi:Asp-tRNA(Asn)/Glu-tRNA(Gln) amidotransferase A subunit family amidase